MILTIENKTNANLMVPGIYLMLAPLQSEEMDWDEEVRGYLADEYAALNAMCVADQLDFTVNGYSLSDVSCLGATANANVLHRTTKEYLEGVCALCHLDGNWVINPTPVDGVDPRYWFIEANDTVRAMTDAEIDTQEGPNMVTHKLMKVGAIHNHTLELNAGGFTYASCNFSLDESAQTNWDALMTAENAGLLTYPLEISQSDGTSYTISDATSLLTFVGTALTIVNSNYASERVLISQAWAAANKTTLDAIEDNR